MWLLVAGAALGMDLSADPWWSGEQNMLAVTGAAPYEKVRFYYTFNGIGPGRCAPIVQVGCMGIAEPIHRVATATADAAGMASVRVLFLDDTAGRAVAIQALGMSTGQPSNPLEWTASYGLPAIGFPRSLVRADSELTGVLANDIAGDNVAAAGDVDGDGLADLWIGAKKVDTAGDNAGAAYLVRGPVAGDESLSLADATVIGEAADDYAGGGLAGPGDVNGDGLDDLLIGAKYADLSGLDTGAAYVLYGPVSGQRGLATAEAVLTGEHDEDLAGGTLAGAGDVDGDGFADLLVGSRDEDTGGTSAGAIYLVLAPVYGTVPLATVQAKLTGEGAYDIAGGAMDALGDVDGDGNADFAGCGCAASIDGVLASGAVYVFTHLPVGTVSLSTADARVFGTAPGELAGSIGGPGDVDGDGYDDLLVGAPGEATGGILAGSAFLVRGPIPGDVPLPDADAQLYGLAGEELGFSVDGAGDVNADGAGDLLLGALGDARAGGPTGAAWVVTQAIAGVSPVEAVASRLEGIAAGDEAGHQVAGVGDTDGDGYDDLLIGAHYTDTSAIDAGSAFLVLGGPGW